MSNTVSTEIGGRLSTLVLSTFAANMLYGLIPVSLAFLLDVLFVLGSVYFSYRHKSQPLACLSLIGAFLIPILMPHHYPNLFAIVVYELIASIAFLFYAFWKGYTVLYFLAFGLLHIAFIGMLFLHDASLSLWQRSLLAFALVLQHLVLIGAYLWLKQSNKRTSIMLLSSFLVTFLWWNGLLQFSGISKWLLLGLSILYFASAIWRGSQATKRLVMVTLASLALMLFFNKVFAGSNIAVAYLLEGSAVLFLSLYLKSRIQFGVGVFIYMVGTLILLSHPLTASWSGNTFAGWFILVSSLHTLRRDTFISRLKIWLFWLESILLLTFITELTNVVTRHLSMDLQHLYVSFAWAVFASILVVYGILRNSKMARFAGVAFLFMTLAKLIVVDIPSVTVLIRAVLFIGLGGLGIVISRLFYRKGE